MVVFSSPFNLRGRQSPLFNFMRCSFFNSHYSSYVGIPIHVSRIELPVLFTGCTCRNRSSCFLFIVQTSAAYNNIILFTIGNGLRSVDNNVPVWNTEFNLPVVLPQPIVLIAIFIFDVPTLLSLALDNKIVSLFYRFPRNVYSQFITIICEIFCFGEIYFQFPNPTCDV